MWFSSEKFVFKKIYNLKLNLCSTPVSYSFFVFTGPDTVEAPSCCSPVLLLPALGEVYGSQPFKAVKSHSSACMHIKQIFLYQMFTRATCKCVFTLYSQTKTFFLEREEAQQRPAGKRYVFWCKSESTPVNFLEALKGSSGALPGEPI